LINSWFDIRKKTSKTNKSIEKLIKKLRKTYVIACLTNTTSFNDKVETRRDSYNLFDIKITSLNTKTKKPQLKIYKILIKKLNKKHIPPKETVFIDNEQKNLVPADRLGIKTILFKNNKQLIKALRNLGVNIK